MQGENTIVPPWPPHCPSGRRFGCRPLVQVTRAQPPQARQLLRRPKRPAQPPPLRQYRQQIAQAWPLAQVLVQVLVQAMFAQARQ